MLFIGMVMMAQSAIAQSSSIQLQNNLESGHYTIHGNGYQKYFAESDQLFRSGFLDEALLVLDEAIAEHPFLVEIYLKRANLLAKMGRIQESKRELDRAKKMNVYVSNIFGPNRRYFKKQLIGIDTTIFNEIIYNDLYLSAEEKLLLRYAMLEKMNGNLGSAMAYVEELESISDYNTPLTSAISGNIHLLLGDYNNAIQAYSIAIEDFPNLSNLYYNRGVAKLFTYNRSSACEDLRKSDLLGHPQSQTELKHFCYN